MNITEKQAVRRMNQSRETLMKNRLFYNDLRAGLSIANKRKDKSGKRHYLTLIAKMRRVLKVNIKHTLADLNDVKALREARQLRQAA